MSRKVVVLATIHALQGAENRPLGKFEDLEYRGVIEALIEHYFIDSIFEVTCACGPAIAEKLANSRGLRYRDVDSHAYGIEIDTEEGVFVDEEKLDAQVRREEFWVKRMTEQGFGSALFICGYMHIFSIAVRLQDAGFAVALRKYLPFHKFYAG